TKYLDSGTPDLLEQWLTTWPAPLLLVSHDRAFIDHVVTSTLVFEGAGRVQEYVGGYEDWLRKREPARPAPAGKPTPAVAQKTAAKTVPKTARKKDAPAREAPG